VEWRIAAQRIGISSDAREAAEAAQAAAAAANAAYQRVLQMDQSTPDPLEADRVLAQQAAEEAENAAEEAAAALQGTESPLELRPKAPKSATGSEETAKRLAQAKEVARKARMLKESLTRKNPTRRPAPPNPRVSPEAWAALSKQNPPQGFEWGVDVESMPKRPRRPDELLEEIEAFTEAAKFTEAEGFTDATKVEARRVPKARIVVRAAGSVDPLPPKGFMWGSSFM
jgi:hypothetical protein